MIDNKITRELLFNGEFKKVGIFIRNSDGTFSAIMCKVSKWFKNGSDIILKLKTGKEYPFGHKYIFRSLEEVL